jgi:Skp family chaperone for outer membrane proteins
MKKLITLLCLFSVIEIHSQELAGEPDVAKEMIRQWIQTEKQLSNEQETWKQEKAHISELLVLYEKELKLLNQELAAVQSVELDDEKKQQLEEQILQEDEKRKQLRTFLLRHKPRMIALMKKFPQPLQDQISETVDDLNSPGIDSSARDLLMPMLSVVEAGNSFNAGVFRASQKVVIGVDEWQAEVMYLGLSRAYFWVGNKAGIGTPSPKGGGWQWKRDDTQLKEIKKAMSVFDKATQPELIKLSLKVN